MIQKVKVDIDKNRLYITIADKITKQDFDKLYKDVLVCVTDLQPGFDVVTDLTACNFGHLSGLPTFRRIMNSLITSGVGEVVRVVNEHGVIYKQILNFSSKICSYMPIYVTSHEEAEKQLEKSLKRKDLRFEVPDLLVYYKTDALMAKGEIINLSTNGCAIRSEKAEVIAEEEILITLVFKNEDISSNEFSIKARVISVEGNTFSAQFMGLDDEQKDQLWQCLIHESERDI